MRALVSHLGVPVPQIRVGHFSRHIEDHDADVRAKVISWMQFVERFLASRVPDVYAQTSQWISRGCLNARMNFNFTYQLYMSYFRWCSCSGT